MIRVRLIIVLILFSIPIYGQGERIDQKELNKMEFGGVFRSAISLQGGGKVGFVGASYDLFLSPRWRFGIGAGFNTWGTDFRFFPYKIQRGKLRFNFGLRARLPYQNVSFNSGIFSLPIGVSFFTVRRINLELDAGPGSFFYLNDGTSSFFAINEVIFSAKIGYRFSVYSIRRSRRLNREI